MPPGRKKKTRSRKVVEEVSDDKLDDVIERRDQLQNRLKAEEKKARSENQVSEVWYELQQIQGRPGKRKLIKKFRKAYGSVYSTYVQMIVNDNAEHLALVKKLEDAGKMRA